MNTEIKVAYKQYICHIKKMQRCYDQNALMVLEEQRCILHSRIIDALRKSKIQFCDRFDAVEIAERIFND